MGGRKRFVRGVLETIRCRNSILGRDIGVGMQRHDVTLI